MNEDYLELMKIVRMNMLKQLEANTKYIAIGSGDSNTPRVIDNISGITSTISTMTYEINKEENRRRA